MIGRGLRRADGKKRLVILDHANNTDNLGRVDSIHFDKLHDGQGARISGPMKSANSPRPRGPDEAEAVPRVLGDHRTP